ncbi:T9SS type A sorting domain-containing protein [Hymenobacter sp. J193]|uniref:T9SS type A sorting domain-containing protein n=1 Tax=Hymenobacter sp. J193 TaxID=2898429 RepID=UPI0021518E9F|nr:T9SS type A sorting domain-containing protein [Hymenobacter sp. J193]MCR5888033.1 T9SS type A sorting domain-containing protein [Hymenobacter sp. J193]
MKLFSSLLAVLLVSASAQLATAQTKPAAKPAAKAPAAKVAAKPAVAGAKPAVKPAAPKPAVAAKPLAAGAKAAPAEAAPEPPALISDKLAPAAPNSTTLKVRLENNPITKRMQVRTNANGPTRVEVNDEAGRPVVTSDLVSGDDVATIDVSNLPAGYYIIKCTSGERTGMKRVMLGK